MDQRCHGWTSLVDACVDLSVAPQALRFVFDVVASENVPDCLGQYLQIAIDATVSELSVQSNLYRFVIYVTVSGNGCVCLI